mgnify:CR=1 FL=1
MSAPAHPAISLHPHADCDGIDLERLEGQTRAALPHCLASPGPEDAPLPGLDEIEVSLVSDEAIAQVHGEFMDDPDPTDVITFQHGEILVSVDTARREGPLHGNSPEEETLLYIVHGLLHLNGHTDLREPDRTAMHRRQEAILARVLGRSEPGWETTNR